MISLTIAMRWGVIRTPWSRISAIADSALVAMVRSVAAHLRCVAAASPRCCNARPASRSSRLGVAQHPVAVALLDPAGLPQQHRAEPGDQEHPHDDVAEHAEVQPLVEEVEEGALPAEPVAHHLQQLD